MVFILTRLLAWIAALAVLPACWAATLALARMLPGVFLAPPGSKWIIVPEGWALIGGAALYALWHRIRPPEFLYTFAHEMTHLIFGLLFGKKMSRLVVSRGSGQVAMSGTNFLITLAPYFFPLLAAVVLAGGAVAEWGVGDARFRPWAAFLTGLALAFHVAMTFRTLATAQPDIERGGKLFSWSMIYLIGVLFAGGAALAAAGGAGEIASLSGEFASEGMSAYLRVGGWMAEMTRAGIAWARQP